MTRDYKNVPSKKKSGERSCLVVGLIGLVIGVGIGFGVQYQRSQGLTAQTAPAETAPAAVPAPPPEPTGPSYDFYTLLPDLEVKVGDGEQDGTGGRPPAEAAPASKPAPTKPALPAELYV